MEVLRTPDERFDNLPGWHYEPEYLTSEWPHSAPLRSAPLRTVTRRARSHSLKSSRGPVAIRAAPRQARCSARTCE
eukprot:COSAG06_NODE_49366_length_326_cov_0.550661_1_plen_76_part_00